MKIDGIDYGEVTVKGVTYQLGPDGPVDKAVCKKLEWGTATECITCDTRLGIPGGMCGTDLCGPCCTGEAATLDEFGATW